MGVSIRSHGSTGTDKTKLPIEDIENIEVTSTACFTLDFLTKKCSAFLIELAQTRYYEYFRMDAARALLGSFVMEVAKFSI